MLAVRCIFTDACTVKLALCVSLLSDITLEISDLRFQISKTLERYRTTVTIRFSKTY